MIPGPGLYNCLFLASTLYSIGSIDTKSGCKISSSMCLTNQQNDICAQARIRSAGPSINQSILSRAFTVHTMGS